MTEMIGQGEPQEMPQGNQDDFTGNPAWSDVLNVIPKDLHSQVTPHFQQWDRNYQNSINKVHSQYESWKPYQENGITPEQVDFALGLMNAVSENPQEVISALQEWMEAENGEQDNDFEKQGQFNQQQPNEFDISNHPAYQDLQGTVQTMAQILLNQREQEEQLAADEELEEELEELHEHYGDFDENYVLGLMLANEDDPQFNLEDAVQEYQNLTQQILGNRRQPGPPVLGSGGAFPNTSVDPRKMNSSETRSTVANLLRQALNQ